MKFRQKNSRLFLTLFFILLLQPLNIWALDASVLQRSNVNAFDRLSMYAYSDSLDLTSKVFAYAALLTPTVLITTPNTEWLSIGIMYAESVALTFGLKEVGKLLITRNRPYMYFDDYPQKKVDNGDYKQSIPSGHSALAFTGATFTTFVFNQYYPDSKWKVPVIAGSYTLATTTALLRNASGNHFLTDIIAGASIGAFSGFIVPWLHTRYFAQTTQKKQSEKTQGELTKIQNISFGIIPAGFTLTFDY